MVSKKNALGKGLSALLENSKTDITSNADHRKVKLLVPFLESKSQYFS